MDRIPRWVARAVTVLVCVAVVLWLATWAVENF
jgi:hypothetical protein